MDIEHIKEDLSICYLKTIAVVNGIALEEFRHDEDSTDVVLKKILELSGGQKFNSQISVQLKSTSSLSQYVMGPQEITYKLKVKNYNDLCANSAMPSILGLFILPENTDEWVNWDEEELLLKGQMFWISLQGKAVSTNIGSVSVKIPKSKGSY
ncbi:DUF4365 domain-containing protein [Butyrivibrio fibrisolvens]|uniref:DUF4365 domain-containing protein n=1 Tax=Butyrivibrio fibrisolvens TaxID=831 RepID=UPI000687C49E|nr:DUF4365 domain-containing protein [Butyrivibrio fibrisolvens]